MKKCTKPQSTLLTETDHHFVENARAFYHIPQWSEGYFDINANGNMCVKPWKNTVGFDLFKIIQQLKGKGIKPPYILRFPDIIKSRVNELQQAFINAFLTYQYPKDYTLAFPVKVNHHQHVLTALNEVKSEPRTSLAFEVGTKGELLLVLSKATEGSTIVCNGYKDEQYLKIAHIAEQLGHQIIIVIEKPYEAALILETSRNLNHWRPLLGIRLKLSSMIQSYWQETSGNKAKFGVNTRQFLELIHYLQEHGWIEQVKLLHAHLGSQLVTLEGMQHAIEECCLYYKTLNAMGVVLEWIDLGGGLGINYDGKSTPSAYSRNYHFQDYANTIVKTLLHAFTTHNLQPLHLLTESGRAITAHHAMVITQVIEQSALTKQSPPLLSSLPAIWKKRLNNIQLEIKNALKAQDLPVIYTLLRVNLQKAHLAFIKQDITLEQKANLDHYLHKQLDLLREKTHLLDANTDANVEEIYEETAQLYHLNFSIFQSIPDVWGIGQVFPTMPLHHLHQPLTKQVKLVDLTCDSDGCVQQYSQNNALCQYLTVPDWEKNALSKYIGFFLTGAYQEILNNQHNLLSEISVVNCQFEEGHVKFNDIRPAQSISATLSGKGYEVEALFTRIKKKTFQHCDSGQTAQHLTQQLLGFINQHSYLELD